MKTPVRVTAMRPKHLFKLLSTIALASIGVFGSVSAAQAGWFTLSVSSDTSDVTRNSPTPAMVLTVSSFTPMSSGFSTISIDFRTAAGGSYWAWKNTCAGSGLTLSSCGISSITVGGVSQTPQSVQAISNNQVVEISLAQTFTATTSVVITLAPGALTVPDRVSGEVADIYFGPYVTGGMEDAGSTGIISINSKVTFNPGAGSGSPVTQLDDNNTQLTANTFSRSGYTFAGWATSNGSNTVVYDDGDNFNFANNLDLYAVWTQNPSTPTPTPTPQSLVATGSSSAPLAETGAVDPIWFEVTAFVIFAGVIILAINRRKTSS